MLKPLIKELNQLANPEKAKNLARFFKTGPGEYGEGDIFLGITVPDQRVVVKKYQNLTLNDCQKLLTSKIHEHRLVALLILVKKFKRAKQQEKQRIYNLYLKNTQYINNWDLVDLSAPNIVGNYLLNVGEIPESRLRKKQKILYRLANSKNLWQRRIAVLATFEFIKNNQFDDSIKIAKILINDKHDLIHKAVGWMLREIGKRDQKLLENFLNQYAHQMPRTMLRYSIEKFADKKRKYYLKK